MQMGDSMQSMNDNQEFIHWTVDVEFFSVIKRLKFPNEPKSWSEEHVRFWLNWAIRKFDLRLQEDDWRRMTGKELNELSFHEFKKKIQFDPGNRFWIHLEMLRQTHYTAIPWNNEEGETVTSIENRLVFTLPKISYPN